MGRYGGNSVTNSRKHFNPARASSTGTNNHTKPASVTPEPVSRQEKLKERVLVNGRAGTVSWDGRPAQKFVTVLWDDDGTQSDVIAVESVTFLDKDGKREAPFNVTVTTLNGDLVLNCKEFSASSTVGRLKQVVQKADAHSWPPELQSLLWDGKELQPMDAKLNDIFPAASEGLEITLVRVPETVTCLFNADSFVDEVYYNDADISSSVVGIKDLEKNCVEREWYRCSFQRVPGAVLALSAMDNQSGHAASFAFECSSNNPASPWNFALSASNAKVTTKAFGTPGQDTGHVFPRQHFRPQSANPPIGWQCNDFDDRSWGHPDTLATPTALLGKPAGQMQNMWYQQCKYTFYRIVVDAPRSAYRLPLVELPPSVDKPKGRCCFIM